MNQLAIVIPYYKIEFFDQCLESLAKQTCKDFKVYIGDDCSPADPTDLINKYRNRLDIHYTRFSENLGRDFLTKQWDRCITLSEGEPWLMMPGDDDLFSENVVEEFYKELPQIEKDGFNVVRCNVTEIDGNGVVIKKCKYPNVTATTGDYIKCIAGNYHVSLPEYIFKRSCYEQFGFHHFPLAYGSDNVAWLEFSKGGDVYTLPDSWCYMRYSDVNISGSKSNLKTKMYGTFLSKKYIIKHLLNYFEPEQRFQIIKKAYKDLLFYNSKAYGKRIVFLIQVTRYLSIGQLIKVFIKG